MKKSKTLNAILMVAGTSVGTGVLGLPIATTKAGLLPTFAAFLISWAFMTLAALYILEVKMRLRGNYNLSSMIRLTLGRSGEIFSSFIILLLLYSLLCTYMMAGSAWLRVLIINYVDISNLAIIMGFTVIFACTLYCKDRVIYNINNFLAVCLIIAFIITIGISIMPHKDGFITTHDVSAVFPTFPMLLTTFGFSIIVPAVTEYLQYEEKATRLAIYIGGGVALIAYVLWEWVTLGHIPSSDLLRLHETGDNGTGVILAFADVMQSQIVSIAGRIFAIFAAITSFMGVSVALMHFLTDQLDLDSLWKLSKNDFVKSGRVQRIFLLLIIYIPPILITSMIPRAFVEVLGFAGVFVAILLGLLPGLMVYSIHRKTGFSIGKKIFLILSMLFFVIVIIQEVINFLRLAY